jgi:hypothetical protein
VRDDIEDALKWKRMRKKICMYTRGWGYGQRMRIENNGRAEM